MLIAEASVVSRCDSLEDERGRPLCLLTDQRRDFTSVGVVSPFPNQP